jgi:hypothetical protein
MQTQNFRRGVLALMALGLTLGTLAILGCGDDDDEADEADSTLKQAVLRGAEEVPPVTTTDPNATGSVLLTVKGDQTEIEYTLSYSGLNGIQVAHIHVGATGVNGPVILFLCSNQAGSPAPPTPPPPACPNGAGTVEGTLTAENLIPRLTSTPRAATFAEAVSAILNGLAYANAHTTVFPNGEIRGQLR